MHVDKNKLLRQEQGVVKFFNSSNFKASKDRQGVLNYFTGVGKTYTAILIIKEYLRLYPLKTVEILLPREVLYMQWSKEIQNRIPNANIKITTSGTYIHNPDMTSKVDLLVVDELHMFYDVEVVQLINNTRIKFTDNLGLTAHYKDKKGRHKSIEHIFPVIDIIEEFEALAEGFISQFIEYNLKVSFTEAEQEQYNRLAEVIDKYSPKFGDTNQFGIALFCYAGGKGKTNIYRRGFDWCQIWAKRQGWYKGCSDEIDLLWNPSRIMGYAKIFVNAIKQRKDLLYNAENKLVLAKELVFKFDNCKTIVFGQSTNLASKLSLMLNSQEPGISVAFHSNIQPQMLPSPKTGKLIKFGAKRLKEAALEGIKNGTVRVICTASALDVGFDVEDINLGIITSNTSSTTQRQQRGGRVKRVNTKSMFPDKEIVLIVNMYVENSQEEKWLKDSQKKNKNVKYWVDSIEEINYNPTNKDVFDITEFIDD